MHTYLIICGIILNVVLALVIILLVLVIILGTISEIKAWRYNKKKAAEHARKQAQYKEELREAKQVWQQWAKELAELEQNCAKETDKYKQLSIQSRMILHSVKGYHYFSSIDKSVSLYDLSKENNWVL